MKPPRRYHYAVIAAILVGYVAIRFWNLTTSCLWFDEIFSIHAAEHPWNSILSFVALDLIHPPLFYVLLKLWIGAGGESLFWLRLFPVLFAIVAVFPFLALCRELKLDIWPTIIGFFFFAVNGSLIKYAQEVRMYSLLLCLSLFSMWLFTRYFQKGKSFFPLVIVNILMVYSHYFGWFVIVAEVVAILIFQRAKIKRILLMFAAVFISFVPWIVAIWQAASSGSELSQNIGWMARPGPFAIGQLVLNLVEPFYYQASSVDPISIYRSSLPILFIAVVAIALYFGNWKQQNETERQTFNLMGLFVALPLIVAFAASWLLPYSIWGTRHLIIVFAPVSMLLAIGLAKIQIFWLRIGSLTMLVLLYGYALVIQAQRPDQPFIWCGFEPIGKEVDESGHGPIYTFEDLVAYHLWFTYRDKRDLKEWMQVVKINGAEGMEEDKAYFLPRGFDDVLKVDMSRINADQLWIIYRAESMDLSRSPLRDFTSRGYSIIDEKKFDGGSSSIFAVFLKRPNSKK